MNSSGIKRGLATTAVSALAIAGLPLFASSASAAEADKPMSVAFTGPARNAGDEGALVVLKVPAGSVPNAVANDNPATLNANEYDGDLALAGAASDALNSQNSGSQTVEILGYTVVGDAANNEFGGLDTFDEVQVRVKVTTAAVGQTASFRIFNKDAGGTTGVDASEARADVSVTTAGAVASISVDPSSQTRPVGVQSDTYTATLRDNAGRLTQFNSAENAVIEGDGATISPNGNGDADTETVDSDQFVRGAFGFKATGVGAPTVHNITITSNGAPAVVGNATLSTIAAATVTANELDIVSAADDWKGFGGGGGFNGTNLGPNATKVTFDFDTDDANETVTLTFTGNGVTFGGQPKVTKSVQLDANGLGSIDLDVDAASIQLGDTITVSGTVSEVLTYAAATPATIKVPARYVTALKGTTDVTVQVVDNYGNPVTSGEVGANIAALSPNENPATNPDQRKAIGTDGKVTFSFTDAKAVAGQIDTVDFTYYTSSVQPNPVGGVVGSTQIRYTTDGKGADFTTTLDNVVASGPGYNPAANPIVPLTDAVADAPGEVLDLNVLGGEPTSAITVSVNNGALILEPGETDLDEASASISDVTGAGGALPAGYEIIGTKTGTATVTVTNAGRTETSDFVVKQAANAAGTARNVELSGPTAGVSGDVVTFTAKITDAFGNPVAGFSRTGANNLNVTVSGPGSLQDGSAQSDANGNIELNVRLFDNADSPVTVNVTAFGAQFGAGANQVTTASAANSGPGLPASVSTDSATLTDVTNLEELEAAVEAAQARVDAAQTALNAEQADVDVAQANLDTLKAKLDAQKAAKAKAKKDGDRKKVRVIKKRIKATKAAIEAAQADLAAQQADVDAAQAELDAAEAELAEAQANLEEAQN